MPYTVLVTATAEKQLKKLPADVKKTLIQETLQLREFPLKGEQLTGELRRFRSLHVKLNNVHYRIVYEVSEGKSEITIRAVGIRENFYQRRKEMKLKPAV